MKPPNRFTDPPSPQERETTGHKADDYAQLYTQHRQWMLRHVMKLGVSREDAEEVVQEAFVRLLRLDEPDTHSYLRSYLQRIATNIAIDRYRRQKRGPEVNWEETTEAELSNSHQPSSETILASRETLKLLHNVLQELPPKCREAFYLYKVQGYSYAQVAKLLGVTESMVRKYVLRALRHSYRELKDLL